MTVATELSPREKVLDSPAIEELAKGLYAWRNPRNGFLVIDLKYSADPKKADPNWAINARAGMPRAEWNREFGEEWQVHEGKPVYEDYDEKHHVVTGTIMAPRRARLVSGWDGGPADVNLAWCLGITAPGYPAIKFIDEYWVDDGDVEDFIQVVHSRLMLEWIKLGGFSLHFADQAVFTQSGIVKRSMADSMRSHGFNPQPAEISFAKRRRSVEKVLTNFFKGIDGTMLPRLQVHERCEMIRAGFKGGYRYPEVMGTKGSVYRETPVKDKFSHIMNAVEYVCSRFEVAQTVIPYEGRPLPRHGVI